MKVASFNVNDVNKRLPNLLTWLFAAAPDVVCLQELKCPDARFHETTHAAAGSGADWSGKGP